MDLGALEFIFGVGIAFSRGSIDDNATIEIGS
jgi:hypothetical protein